MRLKSISVEGLFGIFEHFIPLNVADRVTIIHGPNGYGKTVLLRLVDAFFKGRFAELQPIGFNKLKLDFLDSGNLTISQHPSQPKDALSFEYREGKKKAQVYTIPSATTVTQRRLFADSLEFEIPELRRISASEFLFAPTGQVMGYEEVIERFGRRLRYMREPAPEPDWLTKIRTATPVRFIETQRLLNFLTDGARREPRGLTYRPSVEADSDELRTLIRQKLAEYGAVSQSLDRSFPTRLLAEGQTKKLPENLLLQKLATLEEKRVRFSASGLLDQQQHEELHPSDAGVVNPETISVLSVYVTDEELKLGVLDEFAEKLELLKKTVNGRFLYKTLTIDRESGFIVRSNRTGELIPLGSLSSGEQHELVLLYELLFRVQPGTLILLDEPELSLHVLWQTRFLPDLLEIAELSKLDVLLATHSPQIINDRWDLTVELRGPIE